MSNRPCLSFQYYLTPYSKVSTATKTYFQNILGDTSTDYLASVATWVSFHPSSIHQLQAHLRKADSYRYTTAGTFSKPYHFIDANDHPPSSCGVDYDRDCGTGGRVVIAIKNYVSFRFPLRRCQLLIEQTSLVQNSKLTAANKAIAAKVKYTLRYSCRKLIPRR